MLKPDDYVQITQIVDSKINKTIANFSSGNQFGVAKIPAHTHNGTDSLQVDPNNLTNSILYYAVHETTLSSAQILALHTTPITIVPNMRVQTTTTNINAVIIVQGITAKIYYNGTAYTGANNLEFRYTNASGAKVTADIPDTFINSGATSYAHVAGVTTVLTPVINSPIVVCVPTANPGTGNSTITFSVNYRVVSI